MATVTIVIEDKVSDGEDGLRVKVDSDPKFPEDDEDQTIAQAWSLEIVRIIMDNASDVKYTKSEAESPDLGTH